ncbi:hypothetical protein OG689_23655 [Kitasatospora sp. NBC_00240]|uniref:hypothetical protein n=1 Tax=Kitasatospora sp. NBC_00240 TaxID=2903567 RepID=UPI002259AAF6|nr:hypothetical protein [Kitasatospora sp. NBC_00240]MCX5212242.1 hypothetical protein [Kitasatospora sp. NBC_00240]
MKFSKRAGAMLLAVGAGVLASQGAAAAAGITPDQVGALEGKLATEHVPFDVPLGAATDHLGLLPAGGHLHGGIPTSLLMPAVPEKGQGNQLVPERIIPALAGGKVGPELQAAVPLPTADRSTDLGDLLVDAPAAPLNLAGPALTLGRPVSYVEGTSGPLTENPLKFGEIDPQLVTAPVQAVPGAKASLGGSDKRISVAESVENLAATTTATATGVLEQAKG